MPPEHRVSGLNASFVMAPFVHVSPERPGRFSNGAEYGVYYAARDFETALYEVAHHRALFHSATNDMPLITNERVMQGSIDATLHDIRQGAWQHCYHPTDYSASQQLGKTLKDAGSSGIVYHSVRHQGGENFAAFYPDVMRVPVQTKHIGFHWNGAAIDKYFDYETGAWRNL